MSDPAARGAQRVGVVVMARVPIAGAAKTRLCPPLLPDEAAALSEAMLIDRCAQVAELDGVTPAIALAPTTDSPPPALVPPGFEVVPQPPGDIGAGLAAAAAHFLDRGVPVLLVDSDSPTLPQAFLDAALARLRAAAGPIVVLGPAEDGGYHLLGLNRPAPSLFRDVPWSTARVVEVTLARAAEAGLPVHLLPAWWDVDTGADLERLRRALLQATWPKRTAAWLRRFSRVPLAPAPAELDGDAPPPATATPASLAGAGNAGDAGDDNRWRAPWRRLGGRTAYGTPWLTVREDRVRMPDGRDTLYSVIETGECVGALPFVDDEHVLLVRQYRYVAGRVTLEMPTGGMHAGERPEEAMRRELAEEAGVRCGSLEPLGAYHTSKSVMQETAHLFVARDLAPAAATTADETEFIRVERLPFRDVLAMVLSGEIVDSMTIIAVLRVALARGLAP